jgi:hypothetical protein
MAGLHLDAATSTYSASDDDLAALDRKIARLENAAGNQLSRLLADGLDPVIAAHATGNLTEQLALTRTRRQRLVDGKPPAPTTKTAPPASSKSQTKPAGTSQPQTATPKPES